MENLTMQEKVFKHHEGLDPVEGYDLVIFERIGASGEEVRVVIKTGNRFQPKSNWFGLGQQRNYFAIAVSLDREKSFSFSEHFTLDDHIHEFDLTFRLKYCVVNSETVAKRRHDDPLRMIRDEVIEVISRCVVPTEWDEIRYRFREFERKLIGETKQELDTYSDYLGFSVKLVTLNIRLPEEETKLDRFRDSSARDRDLHRIKADADRDKIRDSNKTDDLRRDYEHNRHLKDADYEADLLDKKYDNDIRLMSKKDLLHKFDGQIKLRDTLIDASSAALHGVGENINTPGELLEGFNAAHQMLSSGGGVGSSQPGDAPSEMLLSGGGPGRRAIAAGEQNWAEMVTSDLIEINGWRYQFEQKRALSSAILHIVAEALLDDRADEDALKRYSNRLFELSRQLQEPLTLQQNKLLEKYRKYEQLRQQFK
jgi:hypothetical protein